MQGELDFTPLPSKASDGLAAWREARRHEQVELARNLGLPLGCEVEVWLRGGIRIRGLLEAEELLLSHSNITVDNTRFRIGRTLFKYAEVESCVRI